MDAPTTVTAAADETPSDIYNDTLYIMIYIGPNMPMMT